MQILRIFKLIPVVVLFLAVVQGLAQNPPAPISNPDARLVKQVGSEAAFYLLSKNLIRGNIFFYVLGTVDDVFAQNDVVTITFSFQISGSVMKRPASMSLEITSKSREAKYSNNHRLRLLTDGKAFLDTDTTVIRPRTAGTSYATEIFYLDALNFKDFEKLVKKKGTILEFGGTQFVLTPGQKKKLYNFYELFET